MAIKPPRARETASDTTTAETKPRMLQWWMTANFAVGAGFSAFMALLIPPYITEVTSDAAAAGVVMAVISLAAVLGPVLGTVADRHAVHRLVLTGGVLGMAVGFAAFAIASESSSFFALDAIVLGVSVAAISAIGPVFIVGTSSLARWLSIGIAVMFALSTAGLWVLIEVVGVD